MVTDKDIEVFKFINIFGKSYQQVLGKTFYKDEISAKNRLVKLQKQNLISYWKTGLMSPRRTIVLTKVSQEYLHDDFDIKIKKPKLSVTTINHSIMEQLAYYYLSMLHNVERTTVYTHQKQLHHIPDIMFTTNNKRVYIEIETTIKSSHRYKKILQEQMMDSVSLILYVTKNKETYSTLANKMPESNLLHFITIDQLIYNIINLKKINPTQQKELKL